MAGINMTDGRKPSERQKQIEKLAAQVFMLAQDAVLIHLRFLDVAVSGLKPRARQNLGGACIEGGVLWYDPVYVLLGYQEDSRFAVRLYLHALLHCIFSHSFQADRLDIDAWDLAVDVAVEKTIQDLSLPFASMRSDTEARGVLLQLQDEIGQLTAERVYRYFRINPPSSHRQQTIRRLFFKDMHTLWRQQKTESLEVTEEMWKKISERVKADLKSFSTGQTGAESLQSNLAEATRDRYDYGELLRRFTVMGEHVQVNDDEFDYIYYTYGLARYGNMPLIEPLEYRDSKKIRDFVIVLDTSASCRGELVRAFLKKTYSILKSSEHFFAQVNVHILQCDNEVRNDTKISTQEDFERFIKEGKLTGFGSTDFRPAFSYVDRLLLEGEFENLKGLIYFTDGYGIYPERMPEYDVIFAFLEDDDNQPQIPSWAIRVVLEEEQLEVDV